MSIKYLPRTPRLPTSIEDGAGFVKALYNTLLETGAAVNAILDGLQAVGWAAPTLINSWEHYGGPYSQPGYLKDASGFVHLRGVVKSGAAAPIFYLPTGFRPEYYSSFAGMSTGDIACRIDVSSDGTVLWTGGGGNGFISIDGISFKAAT